MNNNNVKNSKNFFYQYVYVDDDVNELSRWKKRAEEKNVNILLLKSYKEFFWNLYSNYLSKVDTVIYIDCYLTIDDIPGEVFARALYREGYKQIHLASGYHGDKLKEIPWFTFSKQKGCPFLSNDEKNQIKESVWFYDAVYLSRHEAVSKSCFNSKEDETNYITN